MSGRLTPLRAALLRSGLSQKQVAESIGKHESVVSRIFNGLRCDAETRLAIAGVLGESVEVLFPEHASAIDPPTADPATTSARRPV